MPPKRSNKTQTDTAPSHLFPPTPKREERRGRVWPEKQQPTWPTTVCAFRDQIKIKLEAPDRGRTCRVTVAVVGQGLCAGQWPTVCVCDPSCDCYHTSGVVVGGVVGPTWGNLFPMIWGFSFLVWFKLASFWQPLWFLTLWVLLFYFEIVTKFTRKSGMMTHKVIFT